MADRLHFLDWLRAILVGFVLYAHLTFCGPEIGRPDDAGAVDDHAYNIGTKNTLGVRYQAIGRMVAIPLLFWVSGAACALSFNGDPRHFRKSLLKIVILTVVGIGSNATMWLLGPRDELCTFRTPCVGKGVLFDFTEDPFSGQVEPFFNQMWYTLILLYLMIANWPLFKVLCGQAGYDHLVAQWSGMLALYGLMIMGAGPECDHPWLLAALFGLSEAMFLTMAALCVPGKRPSYVPLRVLHYACASVSSLQLAALPFAKTPVVNGITACYCMYLLLGAIRWFEMGFLMTRPRKSEDADIDAKPLLSRVWPVTLVILILFAPSTNWAMAGVLPYPYYPNVVDRCLYVAGTFTVIFLIDRCSRDMMCRPLPPILNIASVVLYIFQIAFITIFLQLILCVFGPDFRLHAGTGTVLAIILLSVGSAVIIAAVLIELYGGRFRHAGEPTAERVPAAVAQGTRVLSLQEFAPRTW